MHYIGNDMEKRMDMLGMSVSALTNMTFVDESIISSILNNELSYEDIDEFDLALICNALHCDTNYFLDDSVRNADFLIGSMNRGKTTVKSNNVKVKLQDFVKDYSFINDVLIEE